jgi:hypothetical protein
LSTSPTDRELTGFDEFVDSMPTGRTTVTKTDIVATMQLFVEDLCKELVKGSAVKLPIGTLYISASGTFDEVDQPFVYGDQENGHDLRLHFRANRTEEVKMAQSVKFSRELNIDKTAPRLLSAHSVRTDEELAASPGDFLRIRGHHMKFDKAVPELGVWFKNGQEYRAVQYAMVSPGTLIAEVPPEMAAGQYALIVRISPNAKDLKEARLPDIVTIG